MPQLARLDGRLARSARTRHAVVDALLDLLGEGDLRPTAARIAERAGVSLRLVFHHFDDLDAIYAELADRQAERVKPLTMPISVALPLARRIEEFCGRQRLPRSQSSCRSLARMKSARSLPRSTLPRAGSRGSRCGGIRGFPKPT